MKRRRRGAVDQRIERGTTGLNALGRHLLLEMFDCDPDAINSLEAVKGALIEAAKRAQATIVDVVFHEFNPFGISGVVVIAESHLSIHTWPEYRYAAVDIFSCGDALQPEVAASYLVEQFAAEHTSIVEMQRGMFLNSRVPIVNKAAIGGGEGATLREVLKYRSLTRAVMVDIDGEVVELCKKHLEEMHRGAFDDERSEVRTEDARAYLDKTTERFDFVSVDLVEPLEEGPACMLFTKELYALIGERLTPGGTMTVQAGMTKINALSFFTAIHRTLRDVFPVVAGYQTFVSCFGTPWGFIVASKNT